MPMPSTVDAAGRVLALMVAANGAVSPRVLDALEAQHAFERIDTSRVRFEALARECLGEVGSGLGEKSWLSDCELCYLDQLLDAVTECGTRRLLCHLALDAIAADPWLTLRQPAVCDHVLASWHISRSDLGLGASALKADRRVSALPRRRKSTASRGRDRGVG